MDKPAFCEIAMHGRCISTLRHSDREQSLWSVLDVVIKPLKRDHCQLGISLWSK